MIDELNVDWTSLTKADMYTIIKQTEEQNAKLRKQYEAVIADYRSEVAKLRELVLGEKWCADNYGCENLCPLYDKSEPEHCREERLLRELGIEMS